MKIRAFRIHQRGVRTLLEVVQWLEARPLADRQFGGQNDLRLEISRPGQRVLWLDFAHRRYGHGPGRIGRNTPIQDIDLNAGEHFGEDTGVVVDMQTGYAAVQYNHHGPKAGAIEDYLRSVDMAIAGARPADVINPDRFGFDWSIHLTPEGFERIRNLGIYREVLLKINLPSAQQIQTGRGQSLSEVLDQIVPDGTETVTLTMKAAAERNSALGDDGVRGILTDVRRLGDSVKRAVVKGRRAADAPIEEIDLIEEQLSRDVNLRLARGERYAREDRWVALRDTLELWSQTQQLP